MGKFIDLSGQKFGEILVLKRLVELDKYKRIQWECKCYCGKNFYSNGLALNKGFCKSCGCIPTRKNKNLVGQRFGRLLVLEKDLLKIKTDKYNNTYWKCKCDCENIHYVSTGCLMNDNLGRGSIRSCGCSKLKGNAKIKYKDRYEFLWQKAFRIQIEKVCKKHKRDTDLALEDFKNIVTKPCFYCGCDGEIIFNDYHNSAHGIINKMSDAFIKFNGIDRIDSSLGYIKSNSIPCCLNCNIAKNDLKQKDFYQLIKTIYNNLTSKKLIN